MDTGRSEEQIISSRLGKCSICVSNEAKYNCPACSVKTCSLACVKTHKANANCDGVRSKTAMVQKEEMDNLTLLSDYRFLEEIDHKLDDNMRDPLRRHLVIRKEKPSLPHFLHRLKNEAWNRGTFLKFMPSHFAAHQENTTRYNFKEGIIRRVRLHHLLLLTLAVCVSAYLLQNEGENPRSSLTIDDRTVSLKNGSSYISIEVGLTIPIGTEFGDCAGGTFCRDYGVTKLSIAQNDFCHRFTWTSRTLTEIKDCVILQGHWYGGGEQITQPWPIERTPRQETAFVTSDMLQNRKEWYGGVTEAYWTSSQGVALRVDKDIPLFVSAPDEDGDGDADKLCLISRQSPPFSAPEGVPLMLSYDVCTGNNVKEVHLLSYNKFFSKPTGIPDHRMLKDPVWSTWAEYHKEVDTQTVWDFAMAVEKNGFNHSQVEIDDDWETCYGEAKFNPEKFPDPAKLVNDLHNKGFRVTLWIHPFINFECESYSFANKMGYFIKDSQNVSQMTHWWDGERAGIIDFTNEEAVAWWTQRLLDIQDSTGIDSFKFDAGESSWLPEFYTLNVDKKLWPNAYSTFFVDAVSSFGSMIEARVGSDTQKYPIFIRMLDKDSRWDRDNGLQTLVPTLLHFGLLGYPYVLPDMIGGNAYGAKPSKELFVRWAQANTFMPALQFSILPWKYDDEVVELCKAVTSLHTEVIPLITSLVKEVLDFGTPILRPTWWLCPEDESCLMADQQFLVGDSILSVPIVEEGSDSVNVVIPPGNWILAGSDNKTYTGVMNVTIKDITLSDIIYFTREP